MWRMGTWSNMETKQTHRVKSYKRSQGNHAATVWGSPLQTMVAVRKLIADHGGRAATTWKEGKDAISLAHTYFNCVHAQFWILQLNESRPSMHVGRHIWPWQQHLRWYDHKWLPSFGMHPKLVPRLTNGSTATHTYNWAMTRTKEPCHDACICIHVRGRDVLCKKMTIIVDSTIHSNVELQFQWDSFSRHKNVQTLCMTSCKPLQMLHWVTRNAAGMEDQSRLLRLLKKPWASSVSVQTCVQTIIFEHWMDVKHSFF